MSVHKIKEGVFRIQIYGKRQPDGTRPKIRETFYGGKRAADARHAELLRQRDGGLRLDDKSTVAEYVDAWLLARETKGCTPRTIANYRERFDRYVLPALGELPIGAVDPLAVKALYNALAAPARKPVPLSPASRADVHRTLRMLFEDAIEDGLALSNPARKKFAPKVPRNDRAALSEEQAAEFLAALAGTRVHLPAVVMYVAGLRPQEMLALRWPDLDVVAGTITVNGAVEQAGNAVRIKEPKGRADSSRRTIRIPTEVVGELCTHQIEQEGWRKTYADRWADQGLVFPSMTLHQDATAGGILKPHAFSAAWRKATIAAEELALAEFCNAGGEAEDYEPRFMPVTPYIMRHTFTSVARLHGFREELVAEALGHVDTTMLRRRYSHVTPGEEAVLLPLPEGSLGA